MSIAATYVSESSFTVTGDRTEELHFGRKIKCYFSVGDPIVATILGSSYSSDTTIDIDKDTLNSYLIGIEFGILYSSSTTSLPYHQHTSYDDGGELTITASGYATESYVGTVSGSLQTQIDEFTAASGVITDHSELTSLDYASSGHTGFVSTAQLTTTSGDIIDQIPSLAGYATESYIATVSGDIVSLIPTDFISDSEMTTISGDIVAQIPSLTGYATETYVDTVSGSLNDKFAGYYSTSQVDTISGAINTKLDTHKSSSDHDSRYYTETEITTSGVTISGSSSKIYVGVNHTNGNDPLVANVLYGTTSGCAVSGTNVPYGSIYVCYV